MTSADSTDKRVDLSQEEGDWIAHQPPLRIGVSASFSPFSYLAPDGKAVGIDIDILKIISERTGLKFEIVKAGAWEDMATLAAEGKLDMASGVAKSPARDKYFLFSETYSGAPVVIVGHEGNGRFAHLSLMRHAKIVMPRKHITTKALVERLPSARVILTSTQAESFEMVAGGKADATVANLFVTSQYLNEHPNKKLEICGVVTEFTFPLRLGATHDYLHTPLLSVLDKGLASISQAEMDEIFSRHLLFELQGSRRGEFFRKWTTAILIGSALVVALLLLWNFVIRKEIQARRDAEVKLQKAHDELRAVNQSMEVFSHSLSHDLKGPLRAISGFAEVLKEEYQDKLDREGQDYVDRIITAASRMTNLMRDVLSYCRTSRSETSLQTVSLDLLVHQVIGESPPEQRGFFQIVSELPDVRGNPTLLTQCIANLLSNAVKFVPKDRAPIVRIRAVQQGALVKLWVEDNGIGIGAEDRQRIFKMFERVAPADYEGTGIGLAVVAMAVEQMGGTIGVESDPGQGSRFWIQLPIAPEEKSSSKSSSIRSLNPATH